MGQPQQQLGGADLPTPVDTDLDMLAGEATDEHGLLLDKGGLVGDHPEAPDGKKRAVVAVVPGVGQVKVPAPAPAEPKPLAPAWQAVSATGGGDSSGSDSWEEVGGSRTVPPEEGEVNATATATAGRSTRKLAGSLNEIFAEKAQADEDKKRKLVEKVAVGPGFLSHPAAKPE